MLVDMELNNASFAKFGKNFQEKLCELILKDRTFCDQIMEVLDINFLELRHLRVFVKKILEYKVQYKIHPSSDAMISILRAELDDEDGATQKTTRDFFVRVMSSDENPADEDYIKHTALDFCRKQKLKEAMIKSAKLIQNASFDEISKIVNDALKLGSDNNFGYDYIEDFEERFKLKTRNPITTGWEYIDEICRGGLGKSELGVVIAPTGSGKSMALVHLGVQALLQGRTVIHYTLELASTTIATRYDSCITKIPLSEITKFKEDVYENIRDIEGKLIIKDYPTKSASPNTIRTHLEKLYQRDIKPSMIIVDYGDLLKPSVATKEKRHDLETIYEDLRAIAQEYGCPVWTASQTNRSGLNAEVVTMESISEAFNKCFVADFIFTISRTIEDKRTDSGRIFVAKNRNGPDGIVYPITMRTSNVHIDVHRHLDEMPEAGVPMSAKDYKQELSEKYKKYTTKGAKNG